QPLRRQVRLQPLERGEVRADAEALHGEGAQSEIAALREELRTPVDVDAFTVAELEPEPVELSARHRHADARAVARVLQREEDARPPRVAPQFGHLPFDPDRRQAAEPLRDAAVEARDGIDRAI